jgi:hypothetical protein
VVSQSGSQIVTDGGLPGFSHTEKSGSVRQCVACEYAGCICIVDVIVVVPNTRGITAKAIVMVSFCINNLTIPHTYSFLLHFLGNLTGLSVKDVNVVN